MRQIKHDEWLFIVLTTVGLIALFGMGILNYFLGNPRAALIEVGVGSIGVLNLIIFALRRNLNLAGHMVLGVMFLIFCRLLIDGGIAGMGAVWIYTYPSLAFGLKKWATASWYTICLGLVVAGIGVLSYMGLEISSYNELELMQLALSYGVVAMMVSMAERVHGRIEREYLELGRELEKDKKELVLQTTKLRTFETAVSQSSEMMIITDPEGIVLWANAATESVTGFSVSETVGKKAGILWGKLMDEAYYEEMWRVIKTEKRQYVGEIINHRKDGGRFYSTITIYPLLDHQGAIVYFVATQRNITEQKEIDQMKTDFVSLVSHQLRTPLSSMRWNLEMLLSGDLGKLSPKQKKVASQVELANERMIRLITTLLNISRIESGRMIVEPEKVDLKKYLKRMSKNYSAITQGQKLKLVLPDKEVLVAVDTALLTQVIHNLVSNASKYSPKEAEIRLELKVVGSNYEIGVVDQGCGIPSGEQQRIFGKFFRASNVRAVEADGTGMGLYIVKLVGQLLGGTVEFESKVGQGSRFWVTLPIKGVSAKAGKVRLV